MNFYFPLFKSLAKKIFFGRKNIGQAFAPPPYTPHVTPINEKYIQV
jgi:hypothetical protein